MIPVLTTVVPSTKSKEAREGDGMDPLYPCQHARRRSHRGQDQNVDYVEAFKLQDTSLPLVLLLGAVRTQHGYGLLGWRG